jgi:predicted ATPase
VGSSGQVITDVLPDVQQIIGPQPPLPELGPVETQNRFNYVFKNFIRCCCLPEHPLTLFLDDLQWADQASLSLLQQVLMDEQMHHLLVLGAYRNNEVDEHHPLSATLKTLSDSGVRVQTLTLMPLGITHLGQLLSDTLHQPVEGIAELTGLVMQKTTGNPFFVTQFLNTLCSQELLVFNAEQRCWQWDIDSIQAADYTDNVVALMAEDIQRLPQSTQQLLQLAACIGTEFDLAPLEMLTDRTSSTFLTDLTIATTKGLLISSSRQHSYWQTNRYRFVHDRIQQTVYEMGSAEHHQQTHLRLGQWLWEQVTDAEAPERLFEMVDHLNLGLLQNQRFTTCSWAERQQWAELNLKAGRKAKESMAYLAAADYLQAGLTLLGATAWENAHPLTLALYEAAAETAYMSGDFDRMDQCINMALDHTLEPLDQVRSYDIRIQALASQSKLQDAIASGLAILNELGIHLPQHPTALEGQAALVELNALLANWSTQNLLALPEMTNSISLGLVQILARTGAAAFISAPNLLPFIFLKIFELSLQFGNTPGSTIGYLGYALILCGNLGEIERGYQFGQLAAEIVTKLEARQFQAKVYNVLGGHILFWKDPLLSTIPTLLAGYQSGQETGDFEYAGYTLRNIVVNTYFSGKPLPEVLEIIETQIRAAQRLRQDVAFHWAAVFWQNALNLRDKVENPTLLMGQGYNEAIRIPLAQQQGNYTELHGVYLSKLILNYLLGHFASAVENSNLAGQYLESVTGMIETAAYPFYDALARLALAFPTEDETRFNQADAVQVAALDRVNANQAKLRLWATHAPMNFLHKVHLIEAEKARVLGQVLEAEDYYEQAIAEAKANGYLQDLALAYELAAHFYRQRGRELIANSYLKEAYYVYALWGATVKVRQLEAQFPQVLTESPAAPAQPEAKITHPSFNSGNVTSQQLDLQAIFQATRAIAGAIEIPRLQSTLLEILLKGAGAQRGYLLLPSETAAGQTEWWIEATGHSDIPNIPQGGISVEVLQQLPIADHVPVSLVNYVLRTQKSVVLDDATQRNDFSGDAYLRSNPQTLLI